MHTETLSDNDNEHPNPPPKRKPQKLALAKQNGTAAAPSETTEDTDATEDINYTAPRRGRKMVPVRQSRIADRPRKEGEKDSNLKIKIELDLEVEVELYARVKGDVTVGLMERPGNPP